MESNTKSRVTQIQFLRFIFFFLIFFLHCNKWHSLNENAKNGAICAVSFFFILSGVLTGYSSYSKECILSIKEIKNEIIKKIKKFYPLYIITTIVSIFYSDIPIYIATYNFVELKIQLLQLIKNGLLIQSWFKERYFYYNGVAWFLSSIMFLWMFNVPFKYFLNKINKNKYKYLFFIGLFVLIISCTIIYCYLLKDKNVQFYEYVFPISRLGEYLSGMILGFSINPLIKKIKVNKKIKILCTFVELFAIIFLFININLINNNIIWQERIIRWLIPNFIIIIVFLIGGGYISEIFKNKYLVMLGDISFECFLLHHVIINIYSRLSLVGNISRLGNIFSIVTCLISTLVISYIIRKNRRVIKK